MLNRILSIEVGRPLSEWEKKHLLSTKHYVSPICMDTGTVFRLNESFMEVVDPSFFQRQNIALASLLSLIALVSVIMVWLSAVIYIPEWERLDYFLINTPVVFFIGTFTLMTLYFGRHVFFSSSRYPIRLVRKVKKLYAILPGKSLTGREKHNVIAEILWDDISTVFCIHRDKDGSGEFLNIRCYKMDGTNKIVDGFSIGRRWEVNEINVVLAQWNYWCMYMREGIHKLPIPPVYLREHEDLSESFFICMYSFGFSVQTFLRIALMPLVLMLLIARRFSVWTCQNPVWPAGLIDFSDEDAAVGEPKGSTPVGWKETIEARHKRDYPENPHLIIERWSE
ncbi:hypothetical protein OU994_00145 [Pseudoduganella sp. SL102]|uniref:DUF6708 domain-containing protein n=1 Tax=Pseudoduganella sp. SL102 TaxID=2995154 RepID=UPI00248AE28E|nr:DUF6708 domain-containing protein [Pseudoduganella sp. SL102]WBS02751.1 hypothetical protein OU994_00145 [Pseudoduganella sp. SL102]